jgi:hypothetical protein
MSALPTFESFIAEDNNLSSEIDRLIKKIDLSKTVLGQCGNFAFMVNKAFPEIEIYGFLMDVDGESLIGHYYLNYKGIEFDGEGVYGRGDAGMNWEGEPVKINPKTGVEFGKKVSDYKDGMIFCANDNTKITKFTDELKQILR